jgi:hypothetical protein
VRETNTKFIRYISVKKLHSNSLFIRSMTNKLCLVRNITSKLIALFTPFVWIRTGYFLEKIHLFVGNGVRCKLVGDAEREHLHQTEYQITRDERNEDREAEFYSRIHLNMFYTSISREAGREIDKPGKLIFQQGLMEF